MSGIGSNGLLDLTVNASSAYMRASRPGGVPALAASIWRRPPWSSAPPSWEKFRLVAQSQ